jgi:hypothetical protein
MTSRRRTYSHDDPDSLRLAADGMATDGTEDLPLFAPVDPPAGQPKRERAA